MAQFNLNQLMLQAFGITGKYFIADLFNRDKIELNYPDTPELLEVDAVLATSLLGTPIYEQVTLEYNRTDAQGNSVTESYTLEDGTMLDIVQPKIIIKTPIAGADGTVKEFISMDDHRITLRGLLVNNLSNKYPIEKVMALRKVFKYNKEVTVQSRLLTELDVHQLVLENLELPTLEGYQNVQPYVLTALSDKPVELIIRDAKDVSAIPINQL